MNTPVATILLLAACVGNAEWWVMLINRRHSLRYRHAELRRARHAHDLGIILFPLIVFPIALFRNKGLLNGGTFFQQPLVLQCILGGALTGLIPLLAGVVRWHMRRYPTAVDSVTVQHVDTRDQARSPEARESILGKRSLAARIPGNQIYELEERHVVINMKRHLRSAGLPNTSAAASLRSDADTEAESSHSGRASIRLAHFSDVHLYDCPGPGYFEVVTDHLKELQPDAYMFTGDLLDRDSLLPQARKMFAALSDVASGFFVLGNHDWHLNHDHIRAELVQTGWQSLAGASHDLTLSGQDILLAGTEMPWMGTHPVVPETEPGSLRILLSHSPDQRDFALRNRFDLMLCGHNHGGQIILPWIGPVYSPSRFGVRYSGGMFDVQGMLMHVSRGVGARDPLRLRCRPEITVLELCFSGSDLPDLSRSMDR